MVEVYLHRIDVALAEACAEHLSPLIWEVSYRRCFGCTHNRPSQNEHDYCLVMGAEDRVLACLREAVQMLDTEKVMTSFHADNKFPHLPDHLESPSWLRRKFDDDSDWRDLVEGLIVQRHT